MDNLPNLSAMGLKYDKVDQISDLCDEYKKLFGRDLTEMNEDELLDGWMDKTQKRDIKDSDRVEHNVQQ